MKDRATETTPTDSSEAIEVDISTLESQRSPETGLTPHLNAYARVYKDMIMGVSKEEKIPPHIVARRYLLESLDVTKSFNTPTPEPLVQVHHTPTWYTPTPTYPFLLIDSSQKVTPEMEILGVEDITSGRTPTPTLVDPIEYNNRFVSQTLQERVTSDSPKTSPHRDRNGRIVAEGAMSVYLDEGHELAKDIATDLACDMDVSITEDAPADTEEYAFTFTITPSPPRTSNQKKDNDMTFGTAIRTYGK